MYACRQCERPLNQASEICPYCGTDLTRSEPETNGLTRKPKLVSALLRWSTLLIAMWAFLWFVLPERTSEGAQRAEAQVLDTLKEIQNALREHAQANGGFPLSLESMGERLRVPAQRAQREGYRLAYAPGPEFHGVTGSFSLQARAGNYGYRSFYTDQTDIIRATRENRLATAQDQPI